MTSSCGFVPVLTKYKIAYISDQHFPIAKADSEQVINTVSALAAEGVNIPLIIPRSWRNLKIVKEKRLQTLQDFYHLSNGFHLHELLHLPLSKLRLEKYSHGIIAPLWAKRAGFEIIYTRNPLPAFVSVKLGMKAIYETYRIYGGRNQGLGKWLARQTHGDQLLGVITHSQPSKDSLLQLGAREDKIAVIHNGFNDALYAEPLTKIEARRILNLDETQNIACFSGRLDRDKGVDKLVELAAQTPAVDFYFIGNVQNEADDWIEKMAAEKNLRNVHRLPWMNLGKLRYYLFAADVLLIPPTAAPLLKFRKTVLPIKLFQYLAAGRVILAPALPDIQSLLNNSNAVLVAPDNLEAAAAALRRVFGDREWSDALARQARKDSENYSWKRRAMKIISFIHARLEAPPPTKFY
jgi:glycosyltransferase involved in cell wall biosynthesis